MTAKKTSKSPRPLRIQVESPCPLSWSTLEGTDRLRFCLQCRNVVHNLSAMTRAEAAEVTKQEGTVCVAYVPKRDGSVRTLDDRRLASPREPGVQHLSGFQAQDVLRKLRGEMDEGVQLMGMMRLPEDDDD
ncbi:MAG: hypothetical protein RL653_1820 [Pseudomonadota bacterium]